MSKLIDDLLHEYKVIEQNDDIKKFFYEEIDGKLYHIKPMMNHVWFKWSIRIKDVFKVMCGKSFCVHFKCDEK